MPADQQGKTSLESIQAGGGVVRDALLLLVFAMLLLTPTTLNTMLTKAGFTKASLFGFDWEARIQAAEKETEAAKQDAQRLGLQLRDYAARLDQAARGGTEPALRNQARALANEIRGVQSLAEGLGSRLDRNLGNQRELSQQLKQRLH